MKGEFTMKNTLKVMIAIVLSLTLILGTAALACDEGGYFYGAVVATGGDSYIRDEPNLNGSILGSLGEGRTAIFYGYSSFDSRGVEWYLIDTGSTFGWVSSRYTTLYY